MYNETLETSLPSTPAKPLPFLRGDNELGTPGLRSAMKRHPSVQRRSVHGLEVAEVKEFEVSAHVLINTTLFIVLMLINISKAS